VCVLGWWGEGGVFMSNGHLDGIRVPWIGGLKLQRDGAAWHRIGKALPITALVMVFHPHDHHF
jgi:hypothetical protein